MTLKCLLNQLSKVKFCLAYYLLLYYLSNLGNVK